MKQFILVFLITIISVSTLIGQNNEKHVFILSGQSNMSRFKPDETFIPILKKEFGEEQVLVIKDAKGGQPIRRWYKKASLLLTDKDILPGDLYDRLLSKVEANIDGVKVKSITFIWMQGERDAKDKLSKFYDVSFKGILHQLEKDLDLKQSVNFVIGRLSDYGVDKKDNIEWNTIRKVQVQMAKESKFGAWVDCDDLNDGEAKGGRILENGLHYSIEGYKTLGERYANTAIELIKAIN